MSTEQHNAIIVTSWSSDDIEEAWRVADDLNLPLTDASDSIVNKFYTFVIATCGSKEGLTEDIDDKAKRQKFLDWAETTKYEDGSGPLAIVQVSYGERGTHIVSTTCENQYEEETG